MIRVENNTVEVKGEINIIMHDLMILLNALMKKEEYADVIIAVAIKYMQMQSLPLPSDQRKR